MQVCNIAMLKQSVQLTTVLFKLIESFRFSKSPDYFEQR